MIQIRERDLSARELLLLAEPVARLARKADATLLINDRADVAASLDCGVHLTARSLPASVARRTFRRDMLIGVSTHNVEEALDAESGGADFIVFGPVFETESKKAYGPPIGLAPLREVAKRLEIPVLAIGGINLARVQDALDAGVAGIAAISMFTETDDINRLVREIKGGHA
jgi:thiamine-phosphate pyrophosphorylase